MDTYIIRIYRREENDPHALAGTVEEPGIPEKKAFVSLGQLWDILSLNKRKLPKPKRRSQVLDKGGGHGRVHSQQ
ncbi:MAG TPA: hypothetical protein VLW47_10425 [Thermodesulfobacteriota bacterium]|jgi:hypothetical protein|nr:hypothetical protein [Thermodesulfobacteriota bacterium]